MESDTGDVDRRVDVEGYVLGKRVHTGADADVYRATQAADGRAVVLKVFSPECSLAGHAHHEFEVLRACADPHVPRALELRTRGLRHALVIEWIEAQTLHAWVRTHAAKSIADVLEIAIQLADVLATVHDRGYVHRDVTPRNVLVSSDSAHVWLIDFGIALELGGQLQALAQDRAEVVGTLSYLPPEQTGWVDRSCDFRSDLYSFGATFYRVLSGRRPFGALEENALIRAQLTELPTAPHDLDAEVPRALSRLVMRLLNKEPSERYQSARALAADLRDLRQQLRSHARLDPDFVLGAHEIPEQPSFPSRLYGRESQLDFLIERCTSIEKRQTRTLLLSGPSGSGCSAVLDELRVRLLREGVQVATGRFDAHRGQPYAGLADALSSLVTPLLLSSEVSLDAWRCELEAAVGGLAGALTEIVPDLAAVMGDVPKLPKVGERDMQARLALAVERFLEPFARAPRRLLLLFDDLEASDAGSRAILERLISSPEFSGLAIVLVARDTSLRGAGSLVDFMQRLARLGAKPESIELGALPYEDMLDWLGATLGRPPEELAELAKRLDQATDRMPLLLQEFILNLHAQGCLEYASGAWRWQSDTLGSIPVPDGVGALLAAKLEHLDAGARRALELASCVLIDVDAGLLSLLQDGSEADPGSGSVLRKLANQGYLIPAERGYRFAHARIREAAHLRLEAEERDRILCRVGRELLARTPEAERSGRVFEIVKHLNLGIEQLPADLRLESIRLNLDAARQLNGSGAGADATAYAKIADALLSPEDWRTENALAFEVELELAESLSQQDRFAESLAILDALELRHPSEAQQLKIATRRMSVYIFDRVPSDCARFALEALGRLGIHWPLKPSLLRVRLALFWVWLCVRGRDPADLFPGGTPPDAARLTRLSLIRVTVGMLTRFNTRLGCLAACYSLREFVRHGPLGSPATPLVGVACWSWHFERDRGKLEHYIHASEHWIALCPDPVLSARAQFQLDASVLPWFGSRSESVERLRALNERLLAAGDLEYARYTQVFIGLYSALGGLPVDSTLRALHSLDHLFERGYRSQLSGIGRLWRAFAFLQCEDFELETLLEVTRQDDRFIHDTQSRAESYLRSVWMLVHAVYGQFEVVLQQWESIRRRLLDLAYTPHIVDIYFYRGLAAAHSAREGGPTNRWRQLRLLRKATRELRAVASGSADYVPMRCLLEAEYAHLRGRDSNALRLYLDAQNRALEAGLIHLAALAAERKARMLIARGRLLEAENMLGQAAAHYAEWGAHAKVRVLESERISLCQRQGTADAGRTSLS